MEFYAWTLLFLPLVSAGLIYFGMSRIPTVGAILGTVSSFVGLVLAILLLGSDERAFGFDWVSLPGLQIEIGLILDRLSTRMMLVVTGVGFLVHLFSLSYMREDAAKGRYFAGLSLFLFSITGIVLASNLIMTFVFWELVGLSSYLLIGHWYEKASAAEAAKKAFLTNRIGDFGFMIGILLLWSLAGTFAYAGLAAWATTGPAFGTLLGVTLLLLFCGAVGKSAQVPLHVWLPDAMEGPTPVSALIHAATMVAAGVYLMARLFLSLGIGFGEESAIVLPDFAPATIAWIGGITSLLAALMATQQDDIKKILAYSTLSQLGYMVMAMGLLSPEASVFHLYTHAWFKALLFLGAGALIYACHHKQNIWEMGGLARKMPITFGTFAVGTLALCGFPLTAGFFSKEQILQSAVDAGNWPLFLVAGFVAFLTTFYMFRLGFVVFFGKQGSEDAGHAKEVGVLMWVPLVLLAVLSLLAGFGFFAGQFSPLYEAHEFHLISAAFITSVLAVGLGIFLAYKFYYGVSTDPFSGSRVAKVFRNRFYFDEFYRSLVKWGQDVLAAVVHFFDEFLIGGLVVGGAGRAASAMGRVFARLQSGNLHEYAGLFAIGVAIIIFLTVFL